MDASNICFQYEFKSCMGIMEELRYVQDIGVTIYRIDKNGNQTEVIGRSTFKILLLKQARSEGYDIEEIFDMTENTHRVGTEIFDFKQCDVKQGILNFYDEEIKYSNICILERLGIKTKYRGVGIACKLIKDIVHNWGMACELFVMQPFPLQGKIAGYKEDELGIDLELNKLEPDMEEATRQLTDYYKSTGFESIPRYKGLLFYTPVFRNKKMDAISLEELE